jgi:hypothetical protein
MEVVILFGMCMFIFPARESSAVLAPSSRSAFTGEYDISCLIFEVNLLSFMIYVVSESAKLSTCVS